MIRKFFILLFLPVHFTICAQDSSKHVNAFVGAFAGGNHPLSGSASKEHPTPEYPNSYYTGYTSTLVFNYGAQAGITLKWKKIQPGICFGYCRYKNVYTVNYYFPTSVPGSQSPYFSTTQSTQLSLDRNMYSLAVSLGLRLKNFCISGAVAGNIDSQQQPHYSPGKAESKTFTYETWSLSPEYVIPKLNTSVFIRYTGGINRFFMACHIGINKYFQCKSNKRGS